MKELASKNQQLSWGTGKTIKPGSPHQAWRRKIVTWGRGWQEETEDGSEVPTEPAGHPEQDQSVQLAGEVSSHEDQKEHLDSLRSPSRGLSISNYKLIKKYKNSSNATKKNQSNKVVGHPEGEKRTLSQSIKGPDALTARMCWRRMSLCL